MDIISIFLDNFIEVTLEAAPWLLFGLLAAGLIKVWIPESFMQRVLGGSGVWPVIKGAFIGAPLPLCSCGVLPAAIGLKRAGASDGATLSFLVATPETGVDSIGVSYVLLGPFMTAVRVVAAIGSAITTGLLAMFVLRKRSNYIAANISSEPVTSCCSSGSCSEVKNEPEPAVEESGCCSSDDCSSTNVSNKNSFMSRNYNGLKYALTDIWDDITYWLLLGIVLAALLKTFFPEQALQEWGSGLPAMILMLLVGVPMYICATASTPLAAGLLIAGISPGTVLVLLLAGPATNMATIAILYKEMGRLV
ncbi:MAG: SO_0444 family Cu/Zn efflux transporter, partial [Woeseiaceae bacterium]